MPSTQEEQWTFRVGEVSPNHVSAPGFAHRRASLKSARNVKLRLEGAAEGRPGTVRLDTAPGDGWLLGITIEGLSYFIEITAARYRVFQKFARVMLVSESGCPWTSGMLPDLRISVHGNQIFLTHQAMQTQIITRSVLGVWSVAPLVFSLNPDGTSNQPYYRFAAAGVTLTPSARSGSITLTSSASYFATAHVGKRVRLQGREVLITAWTSVTQVTANCLQTLFATKIVPVTDTAVFEVGEIVEGKDSGAKGEIIGKAAGQLTVLMQTMQDFTYDAGPPVVHEIVVGPHGTAYTAGAPSLTTNAAVLDWDEQAISDLRGYPATSGVHRGRFWLANLPKIPLALLASAVNDFTDHRIGTDDSDAIFEIMGDADAGVIRHIFSSEQLLVATNRQLYYCPESEVNPIRPGNFELFKVSPDGASACQPIEISEGVVYANAAGGAVIGAIPTGDVRRSWRTVELSYLGAHLIKQPRSMAYVAGSPDAAEKYVYIVNDDGSLATICYTETESDAVPGLTPWDTDGEFRSVAAVDGECWALVKRTQNGGDVYSLEVFEDARIADCTVDVEVADLIGPATGQTITTPNGSIPADLKYRRTELAGSTCSLIIGDAYIGEVAVDASGYFGVIDMAGDIALGRNYSVECVPWHPMEEQDQRARRRKRRISRAQVRYTGRYMAVNGQVRSSYDGGEDTSVAPPIRDEFYAVPCFGWSMEPTVPISRAFPGPWKLYGYSFEVRS